MFALLAVGYVVALRAPGVSSTLLFSVAAMACAAGVVSSGRWARVALGAGWLALGAGWFTMRIHEAPRDRPRVVEGAPLVVEGMVERVRKAREATGLDVFAVQRSSASSFAVVRVRSANGEGVSGRVRVSLPRGVEVKPGEVVRVRGVASPIAERMNPGESDPRLWAAQEGVFATVSVPNASLVERLGASGMESRLRRAREALHARTHALLPRDGSPERALLRAMLLGEEDPSLTDVRSAFTRLGLAHVVAISGLNLTLMAGVALLLLRLGGDFGRVEHAVVGLLVAGYLVVLPYDTPVWRAGVMALALLGARATGRRYDLLAVLALAGVALLVARPLDLFTLSFQLSFGLVAVLVRFAPRAHELIFGLRVRSDLPERIPLWRSVVVEPAKRLFSASLVCWLVATPTILLHTGLLSPAAVLTTMLVGPLLTLVLLAGYVVLIVCSVLPSLAEALGPVLDVLARVGVVVVERLDTIPGLSFRVASPSLAWVVLATLLPFRWLRRGDVRDPVLLAGIPVLVLMLAAECWSSARPRPGVVLRVDTLAVGDGTCHLLRSGSEAMLWDCGSLRPGIGARLVPRAVRALGPVRVPTLVISHPNLDHYNGVLDAADELGIRDVIVSPATPARALARPHGPEALLLGVLERKGIRLRVLAAGDTFELGGLTFEVLSPPVGADWPEANDHSLVARVEAGGRSMLLTGDAQEEALGRLVREHPGLRADVLELPHHGSAIPASLELVLRTRPDVVVQSTGPSRAGLAFWEGPRGRARWYTTATGGAAWVEVVRDGTIRSGSLRE